MKHHVVNYGFHGVNSCLFCNQREQDLVGVECPHAPDTLSPALRRLLGDETADYLEGKGPDPSELWRDETPRRSDEPTGARRIMQVAGDSGVLYALCDDGTVWFDTFDGEGWYEINNVPQPDDGPPDGGTGADVVKP